LVVNPIRIAVIGVGKIARDQHVPALAASDEFTLVATASREGSVPGVPAFCDLPSLLAEVAVDAVSVCTPPGHRLEIVTAALEAGLHVMLEKPPAGDIETVRMMADAASKAKRVLFTTWHSREAGGVEPAREWLQGRRIRSAHIDWRENIRQWHPGQDWILASDGFGVFDPGINALSIASAILPSPLVVEAATLTIPEGRDAPLAADVTFSSSDAQVTADFDFLHDGEPCWDIVVETDDGRVVLRRGGRDLELPGRSETFENEEYARLYHKFAMHIRSGVCDVDTSPLELVLQAQSKGVRQRGACFNW
jgi:predicted dehydrogenase